MIGGCSNKLSQPLKLSREKSLVNYNRGCGKIATIYVSPHTHKRVVVTQVVLL